MIFGFFGNGGFRHSAIYFVGRRGYDARVIPDRLQLTRVPFQILFPPQDFGDKVTLSSRLKSAVGGLFDGESMVLPVPTGGPPDVPRIQLASADKSFTLQLSLRRLAVEWRQSSARPGAWSRVSGDYLDAVRAILRVFIGEYARPTRFSLNPQFVCRLAHSVNALLAERLFQARKIGGAPDGCKLGLMKRCRIEGRNVNLWMNLASGRDRKTPEIDNVLIVQFDLQSADDNAETPFTFDELDGVLAHAGAMMEERLKEILGELLEE